MPDNLEQGTVFSLPRKAEQKISWLRMPVSCKHGNWAWLSNPRQAGGVIKPEHTLLDARDLALSSP